MVLLHRFRADPEIIIAHFNHGTRASVTDDEEFVRQVATTLDRPFFSARADLGENISESVARAARYQFLFSLSRRFGNAPIYTAHHANDLLESIAINLVRGTGWRGLAPLGSPHVERPLLSYSQTELYRYAAKHQIIFRQDPTNFEPNYLRNRLRPRISALPASTKATLLELSSRQRKIKSEIDQILLQLLPADKVYNRRQISALPDSVALEFLRAALLRSQVSLTRPQLLDFLHAIRTYAPGKNFNLPGGQLVKLHKNYFKL